MQFACLPGCQLRERLRSDAGDEACALRRTGLASPRSWTRSSNCLQPCVGTFRSLGTRSRWPLPIHRRRRHMARDQYRWPSFRDLIDCVRLIGSASRRHLGADCTLGIRPSSGFLATNQQGLRVPDGQSDCYRSRYTAICRNTRVGSLSLPRWWSQLGSYQQRLANRGSRSASPKFCRTALHGDSFVWLVFL